VQEMCEIAFSHAGLDWKQYVVTDPKFYRPAEVHTLLGNGIRAKKEIGWEPQTTFAELIQMMVDADLGRVRSEIARGNE